MRALVIGATGLLGHAICRLLSSRSGWTVSGTCHTLLLPGLHPLDILDQKAVRAVLSEFNPDIVILPASNAHVDYCEAHPEETRRINVDATLAVARAALGRGCRFVFFSSDYVFDGSLSVFREEDAASPLNEYGHQKLAVEKELEAFPEQALVCRVSGLYGWELRPKNFVMQVLSQLQEGRPLRVPSDREYNPTYAEDLAGAVLGLLECKAGGLFHLAGADRLSRAEFAKTIAEVFGFQASLIVPKLARELGWSSAAPRPLCSALSSEKAERLLGRPLWGVRRSLEHMKKTRLEWEAYVAGLMGQKSRP